MIIEIDKKSFHLLDDCARGTHYFMDSFTTLIF